VRVYAVDDEPSSSVPTSRFNEFVKANPYESKGLSPGAGAQTADEQADAAYADLMFTCMAGQEDVEADEAWEKALDIAKKGDTSTGWQNKKSKGVMGDAMELFKALAGGAHIVRKEDGRI